MRRSSSTAQRLAETRGTDLHDVLRERLVFMRSDLIERLTKGGIDGGMLALLGSVGAAIDAIAARDGAAPKPLLSGD